MSRIFASAKGNEVSTIENSENTPLPILTIVEDGVDVIQNFSLPERPASGTKIKLFYTSRNSSSLLTASIPLNTDTYGAAATSPWGKLTNSSYSYEYGIRIYYYRQSNSLEIQAHLKMITGDFSSISDNEKNFLVQSIEYTTRIPVLLTAQNNSNYITF